MDATNTVSHTKMGDSDSGVGVMPGVNSIFWQFGVGVGTGVKYFFMTGVGTGVRVKPLAWSRLRFQLQFHRKIYNVKFSQQNWPVLQTKMGDSDSGVGVKPGVDSIF